MNIKKIILATTLVSVFSTNLAVAVPAQNNQTTTNKAQIEQTRSAFAEFKDDMKCMLNPKKRCTIEQKQRLFKKPLISNLCYWRHSYHHRTLVDGKDSCSPIETSL